jgi:hypothetical protein
MEAIAFAKKGQQLASDTHSGSWRAYRSSAGVKGLSYPFIAK